MSQLFVTIETPAQQILLPGLFSVPSKKGRPFPSVENMNIGKQIRLTSYASCAG
jgi:hypothetical protein